MDQPKQLDARRGTAGIAVFCQFLPKREESDKMVTSLNRI